MSMGFRGIVKPEGRYYHFIQSRIEQAGCRTRKDSTRFVDTLITASPEFFKGKSPKETAVFFQRAADFLIQRVGRDNIVSAGVHMDERTPHMHLTFVPLTWLAGKIKCGNCGYALMSIINRVGTQYLQNLTGSIPPVTPLPCVVPCKLYFD